MTAEYFDRWYADLADSPPRTAITVEALGLPPALESTSLLPWDGIADVVAALRTVPGDLLVDLACGRGGYGFEVQRRTRTRLVGVDFSAVAIERARQLAPAEADHRVGELTRTGIADRVADAVMCIDAMQFAEPYRDGLAECRRILAPRGRLVLTGWEPLAREDEHLPARLRRDIAAELTAAGFLDVRVRHMPTWRAAEHAYWQRAAELDADGGPALASMRAEAERVLPWLHRSRRVLATALAP